MVCRVPVGIPPEEREWEQRAVLSDTAVAGPVE
jgi:hypothetical protein